MGEKYSIVKNMLVMVIVLTLAVFLGLAFQKLGVNEHVTTIFVFAVFMVSLLTEGYVYGIVSAFAGVLAVNYAFTFPFFALDFIRPVNLISAIIMITIAVLTSTLTSKVKRHEAIKAESEKERMRANLLRAVSHDLRTPLTTIYGSSCTLTEDRKNLTEEQQATILRGIREDAEWLMRMVENLLSVTRIDSGKIKIVKIPTVLDELIDSVILKFRKRYPGQEVTLDIPDEIVIIPMDALLIEQVIVNILENAVIHARGMKKLFLRVFVLGEQAIFEIADDGCGISADRVKTIFNGYYESRENPADGQKRNAGIGLSVCATIIKAHGGSISAKNGKTGGVTFRFILNTEEMTDDEQ